jgi:hypothetical protein
MPKLYELRDTIMDLSDLDRANLLAMVEHDELARPYKANRADDEVWSALVRFSSHSHHRSLDAFLKDKNRGVTRPVWQSAVSLLADVAADVEPVRNADDDRRALVELALRCLASDLHTRGIEATPKRLIDNLERIYIAIDHAFPGYVEAGLLHELIRLTPERVAAE